MGIPRLKNAIFCRILVYIVVLTAFVVPFFVVIFSDFFPWWCKAIAVFGLPIAFLVYVFKNFAVLMSLDVGLAMISCHNKARESFTLKKSFSVKKVEKKLSRYGERCELSSLSPRPNILRYRSCYPITVYFKSIEKIVATYHTEFLDSNLYSFIFNSAVGNSNILEGRKKHILFDRSQKKSPITRVTVIIIFAVRVDDKLRGKLPKKVCQNGGDGIERSVLPCVVDLEKGSCTFDSMKFPYYGFQYPAKNRGIRIIRKCLFNGSFPYSASPNKLEPMKDYNPEQSLWSFWREIKKELILDVKKEKQRFGKMQHGEIVLDDDFLYLKWKDRGIMVSVELNGELKVAKMKMPDIWFYPKTNKISKDIAEKMRDSIKVYFAERGYAVSFLSEK